MDTASLAALEQRVTQGGQDWHAYRAQHGARTLNSYLFLVQDGKGFPVFIKSETPTAVELIILQTGTVFSVSVSEFEQHCGEPFVLRPELRDVEPEAFDRYTAWFARAYNLVGLAEGKPRSIQPSQGESGTAGSG